MSGRSWDTYGDWDQIASSGDARDIMEKITGHPVERWQSNQMTEEAVSKISNIVIEDRMKYGHKLAAVDFGCGFGRNSELVKRFYPILYGVDIPEMIQQFTELNPVGALKNYNALYTDFEKLASSREFHCLYDSVVFQHIKDNDFVTKSAQTMHETASMGCVISLVCGPLGKTALITNLENLGWRIYHTSVDHASFYGYEHNLFILRRGDSAT